MSQRILLVEDEPGLLMTLTDRLVSEGFTVETATDGEAGLARALSETFDLIILDVGGGVARMRERRSSGACSACESNLGWIEACWVRRSRACPP